MKKKFLLMFVVFFCVTLSSPFAVKAIVAVDNNSTNKLIQTDNNKLDQALILENIEIESLSQSKEDCAYREKTDEEYLETLNYDYTLDACLDFDKNTNIYAEQEDEFYLQKYSYDSWVIDNFHAIYTINEDSQILVDERIWVNFWTGKHGIYRYLPTRYPYLKGFLYYDIKVNFDTVENEFGEKFNIATRKDKTPFYLKIGDPYVWLYEQHLFRIKYEVLRGIRYFDDHDEFYWNITGSDWPTVILNAKASIILPQHINQDDIELNCYLGPVGSTKQDCHYHWIDENVIEFYADKPFNDVTYDDFTVAVWLPKGILQEPSKTVMWWWLATSNWGLGLPVIIFILALLLWRKYGNDKNLQKTIIAQYDEKSDLSPLIASMLLKSRNMSTKDISAELVYLAVRKYLRIREIYDEKKKKVTDHELILIKKPDDKLKEYQKYLLNVIFNNKLGSRKISSLSNKFYVHLPAIKKKTQEYAKPYYEMKPWIKILYIVASVCMAILFLIIGLALTRYDVLFGGLISSLIIFIFAFVMPKKSIHGLESVWHLKGMKHFINVAEKHRVKFYEDKDIFEKVLPYAMVFGMVDKWTQAFKDIYTGQPSWYETPSAHPFAITSFAPILTSFTDKSTSSFKSMPAPQNTTSSGYRSSGFSSGGFSGGSSGGGFGGGGGGSW